MECFPLYPQKRRGPSLKKKKTKKQRVAPIYVMTAVWVICCCLFPMYKLISIITGIILAGAACMLAKKVFKPKAAEDAEQKTEPAQEKAQEPEKTVQYSPEVEAIMKEGALARQEMARLYNSIREPEVRQKISKLMQISDKIVEDAAEDEDDVPQIKKFLSYYLPTTIKLLNAYDRMDAQGVQGKNISGTMQSIEEMLDTAIAAYEKQLDSLFANQALDIETDISVMNSMLAREGLAGKDF